MTFNFKKALLAGSAIVAVGALAPAANAAVVAQTLTGNVTYAIDGNQNQTPADASGALAGDTIDLSTFTLTISNNQTANDGSGLNLFAPGAITGTTGSLIISSDVTGATGAVPDLVVNGTSVAISGAGNISVVNQDTDDQTVSANFSGAVGTGGNLAVTNAETTTADDVNLTVGGPMPTDVMWPETRMEMAKVLGERGEGFIALSMGLAGPEEWEAMAEVSGAPMLWQALPPSGDDMGKGVRQYLFNWLDSCHQRGLKIYAQGITQDPPLVFTFDYFDLWGSVWNALLGPDVPKAQKLANLSDPAQRAKLREAPLKYMFIDAIDATILHRTYTDEYKQFERSRLGEIATSLGKHVVDVVCDLVAADELRTIFQTRQFDTTLEGVKELIDNPYIIPGLSDGGAHLKYLTAGSYGTEYISKFVREHKMTNLEDAHWRLSALPAFCAGFRDRGTLREGAAADIIVYDYDKLDYTFPEFVTDLPGGEYRVTNQGMGYRYVLVNGEVTIEDDKPTHVHSGELLRGGKSRRKAANAA